MKTDTTYLQQVSAEPQHQYWSEVNRGTQSQNTDISTTTTTEIGIRHAESSVIDFFFENPFFTYSAFVILSGVMLLIIYKLVANFKGAFEREDTPTGMGEDTIYGHDWNQESKVLMQHGAYSEAVVLCYLRWLDTLNDKGIINFHVSKTPGMFIKEVQKYCDKHAADAEPADDILPKTRTLTDNYLRIRYGHKKATEQLAKEMLAL